MSSHSAGSFSVTTNRWMIILIGLLLIFILAFIGFGFFINEKYHRLASPLSSFLRDIRIKTVNTHRVVEKILDGDVHHDMQMVWFELDRTILNFQQIPEDREKALVVLLPHRPVASLFEQSTFLADEIDAYKTSVENQLRNDQEQGHDYEHRYSDVLARLDKMEMIIQMIRHKDLVRFRFLMGGGLFVSILLTLLIATTVRRYEKQKAADYDAIKQTHRDLETKIEEHKVTADALRLSHNLFQTVFETSPDAVVITRVSDSVIIDVNSGFSKYTEYGRDEVIGRSVIDIDIWVDLQKRNDYLKEVLENGSAENWEAVFRTKSGNHITCLLSSKKIDINGEPHLLTDARDITDRKLYEKMINAANSFLRITNRHSKMEPMLKEFIAEIKELTKCSAAAVRIMDAEGLIPYAEAEGFSEDFCNLEGNLSIHSDGGMCVRVIKGQPNSLAPYFTANGSYYINSTTEFLATATEDQKGTLRNTCHRFGYESLALIPIRTGITTLGLIHVADKEPNAISADVVEILESAALQLGTAIQRVCAEQALKEAYKELDDRVKQRTEMLTQTNEQMLREIEERRMTEQSLIEHQKRLRQLSTELLQTEERERRQIATQIHDRIGQSLAITKIQLGALKASLARDEQIEMVDDIRQLITRTIKDTRTLTFELSPPVLYELGLQAALEWLAESIRRQTKLQVTIEREGKAPELEINRRVFLYQAIRELLFNVIKHANADKATIKTERSLSSMKVHVIDNGHSVNRLQEETKINQHDSGFGLFSIREQIQYYGGRLEIAPHPEGGTHATIIMPTDA
jgi:PAS domain S-box-containing protein